jgi:hypothetical protein
VDILQVGQSDHGRAPVVPPPLHDDQGAAVQPTPTFPFLPTRAWILGKAVISSGTCGGQHSISRRLYDPPVHHVNRGPVSGHSCCQGLLLRGRARPRRLA